MKLTTMIAMAAVVGMGARAGQVDAPGPKLIVYIKSGIVPARVIKGAEILASKMFTEAGVRVEWRNREPIQETARREGAIVIKMAGHTPSHYLPGASAEAYPYEGVHITVFYDRLAWAEARPRLAPALLGHVLVHEITHILQGVVRHSESGVMKATWSDDDYLRMESKPLPFTATDVALIHRSLATRIDAQFLADATSGIR